MISMVFEATPLAQRALGGRLELSGPLAELRRQGAALLEAKGLPGPRDEAWRFTSLRGVTDVPFQRANARESALRASSTPKHELAGAVSWVFGEVPAESVIQALPPGIEFWSSRQTGSIPAWAKASLSPEKGAPPFAALNACELEDVWCFRLSGSPTPLQIIYPGPVELTPSMLTPRVRVVVEAGAHACLIETTTPEGVAGASLTNSVSEIFVGQNAELEHVRISLGTPQSRQISSVSTELTRDSRYRSRLISLGGALTRTDLTVAFAEPGAHADLDGLYFASEGEQVDHHTVVEHRVGRCESLQKYKGLADGNGQAIFDGIVRVHQGATGTSAHQQNRNLLLAENAVIHTKPHLEIENDDVKCTHGATVGRLRLDEQFYLQSRGLDLETTRTLLVYAFASEIIDGITLPAARNLVRREFLKKLGNPELFAELTEA